MDDNDKKRIIERYNKRFAKNPNDDIATLAVGSVEKRELSFKALLECGISNGCSVLDVGCGFGDFYSYAVARGVQIDYFGYDINEKFVRVAQNRHKAAKFEVKDVLSDSYPLFDFIVSSTAFNLKLKSIDNYAFIEKILKNFYQHARQGVAIDLLTSYVDYKQSDAFYYTPEVVFSIAKKITKRVTLRHDIPLYQFCLYLYPDFKGWGI